MFKDVGVRKVVSGSPNTIENMNLNIRTEWKQEHNTFESSGHSVIYIT